MTTFAKKSFDAAAYLKHRPTYPSTLINSILKYANIDGQGTAVDLGCGPGQATVLLAASGSFSKVIGTDPGKGMIEAAKTTLQHDPQALLEAGTKASGLAATEYRVGAAEDLSWLESGSVDLVTAGQAAHWFDHEIVYKEIQRILKPGGTVAYWGYSYLYFPAYPKASVKVAKFGLEKLKDYWEPGRRGPESLYDLVPFPSGDGWNRPSFIRQKYDQGENTIDETRTRDNPAPPETTHHPVLMHKRLDVEGLRSQLRTWSSVHTYMEQHNPSIHIADECIQDLQQDLPTDGRLIDCSWPLGILLMKKAD